MLYTSWPNRSPLLTYFLNQFIEAWLTYTKLEILNVLNLMSLKISIHLCNHYHNLCCKCIHYLPVKANSWPCEHVFTTAGQVSPALMISLFWNSHRNNICQKHYIKRSTQIWNHIIRSKWLFWMSILNLFLQSKW